MSEIGVIGQIYEDRRTHKKGKLLERDEKYKTLLMESDDGKSFNITYGGFKSNWRKIDEPATTVEEALQEVEVPAEVADVISVEPKKKKSSNNKKKKSASDVRPELEEATKTLVTYVDSFSSPRLSLLPNFEKKLIAIRLDKRKVVEIIFNPRKLGFTVCSKEVFAKAADKLSYIDGVNYYEKWKTVNYAFFVSSGNFNKLLNDLRPVFVNILSSEEDK